MGALIYSSGFSQTPPPTMPWCLGRASSPQSHAIPVITGQGDESKISEMLGIWGFQADFSILFILEGERGEIPQQCYTMLALHWCHPWCSPVVLGLRPRTLSLLSLGLAKEGGVRGTGAGRPLQGVRACAVRSLVLEGGDVEATLHTHIAQVTVAQPVREGHLVPIR